MLESPKPVITSSLFPSLLEGLLKILKGLSDEDWGRSTACPGWSVKDVALHLLGGEIGNLSSRRDDHLTRLAANSWDELVASINEWNRAWLDASRRISTPLLIELLELTGSQMAEYVESLDPYSIGGSVSWVGPDAAPVWLDIAREYTERWHHQQHIRDAVKRPGFKEPQYFAPVLATFARALPRTLRQVDAPENTVITLTIVGDSGGQWSARREVTSWEFYEGTADRPDVEMAVNEDIAWRLFTRWIRRDKAKDMVTVKGDQAIGSVILDMVSIIA